MREVIDLDDIPVENVDEKLNPETEERRPNMDASTPRREGYKELWLLEYDGKETFIRRNLSDARNEEMNNTRRTRSVTRNLILVAAVYDNIVEPTNCLDVRNSENTESREKW